MRDLSGFPDPYSVSQLGGHMGFFRKKDQLQEELMSFVYIPLYWNGRFKDSRKLFNDMHSKYLIFARRYLEVLMPVEMMLHFDTHKDTFDNFIRFLRAAFGDNH